MSLEIVGVIGIVVLLILMFLRMPLGPAMALVGIAGLWSIIGFSRGIFVLSSSAYGVAGDYMLSPLPLFTLMALFAGSSGMSRDAFGAAHKWVGHLPGGLAMASMGVCGIFAAVCGVNMATAATMSTVAHPEMKKRHYSNSLSLGSICCGSQLGFMIPPSTIFILYAFLTQESVGKLFMAGILPGILITILFIITIYIFALINPEDAPRGEKSGWKTRFTGLLPVWAILVLIVLILVGIYAGFFTPTEAGAVGAFGALVLALLKRRLSWKDFVRSLVETGQVTGMIFMLIIGSTIFGSFIAISELPFWLSDFVGGLPFPPVVIMIMILAVYVITGFFMDVIAVIVLTVPIIHPLLLTMGIDPIWFGVLVVLTIMIGGVTPPVGVLVFTVAGMVKDATIDEIFRGVWPFLIAMIIALILLIVFPQISLFLPETMLG